MSIPVEIVQIDDCVKLFDINVYSNVQGQWAIAIEGPLLEELAQDEQARHTINAMFNSMVQIAMVKNFGQWSQKEYQ